MRITFLVGQLDGGGAERQLSLLARGLSDRGHDVEILLYKLGGTYEALLGPHFRGRIVPLLRRRKGPLARYLAVRRRIRTCSADILHPYLEECCVFATLGLPRNSQAKLVWGVRNSGLRTKNYPFKISVLQFLATRLAKCADFVIFNSSSGRAFYQLADDAKVAVVFNGIDTETFCPAASTEEVARIRQGLKVGKESKLVVFVGRNDPMKGLPDFVKVVSRVQERDPNCEFLVAGISQDDAFAAGLASPSIRFLGRVDQPEQLMKVARVLVSTSSFGEGFPNVIAEALACGTPVVATGVGESPAVIGDCGILCKPGDIDGLADGVIKVLETSESQSERMLNNLRIKNEFGLEAMIDSTELHLLKLVSLTP